ncbi:hypothetical protein HI914_07406 [Erysiphe necator]|nr:hypothetical protein HI914_07406 [Erysiphe necator]
MDADKNREVFTVISRSSLHSTSRTCLRAILYDGLEKSEVCFLTYVVEKDHGLKRANSISGGRRKLSRYIMEEGCGEKITPLIDDMISMALCDV